MKKRLIALLLCFAMIAMPSISAALATDTPSLPPEAEQQQTQTENPAPKPEQDADERETKEPDKTTAPDETDPSEEDPSKEDPSGENPSGEDPTAEPPSDKETDGDESEEEEIPAINKPMTIDSYADGMRFVVEGMLPETAELQVFGLDENIGEYIRGNMLQLGELPDGYSGMAYDIQIIDTDTGQEIEPDNSVTVTVYFPEIIEDLDALVYHLPNTKGEDIENLMNKQIAFSGLNKFEGKGNSAEYAGKGAAAGSPEEITPVHIGDNFIQFETDSFSTYYIVSGTRDGNDLELKNGDVIHVMPGAIFKIKYHWKLEVADSDVNIKTTSTNILGNTTVSINVNASPKSFILKNTGIITSGTITVVIDSKEQVISGAVGKPVVLAILNGGQIPGEPGATSGSYMLVTSVYDIQSGDIDFSDSGSGIINPNIGSLSTFIPAIDGKAIFGIYDPSGVDTMEGLVEGSIDWDTIMSKVAGKNIKAIDGKTVTTANKGDYKIIPYVVKYMSSDGKWHIDCAVVPKSNVMLSYDGNIDTDHYNINEALIFPGSKSGLEPFATQVDSIIGMPVNNTISVVSISTEEVFKFKFVGWDTKEGGSGTRYQPNDVITISEDTKLYAIWESESVPGTLKVSKSVTADEGIIIPEDNFTFSFSFSEGGSYEYKVVENNVNKDNGTVSNNGTIILKANQTAVISGLEHGTEYSVAEIEIPEGYTCDAENNTISGTIQGAQTSTVDFNNNYVHPTEDLTITKQGWQGIDENQSFVFRVVGNKDENNSDVDLRVVIQGSGSTTIKDLPVGNYTVTEDTGWSWRYDGGSQDVTITSGDTTNVTFTNSRNNTKWLNGCARIVNHWTYS